MSIVVRFAPENLTAEKYDEAIRPTTQRRRN